MHRLAGTRRAGPHSVDRSAGSPAHASSRDGGGVVGAIAERTRLPSAATSPAVDLDALAAAWSSVLDAGHRAVGAAGLYLRPDDLRRFDARLEADRAVAVHDLEAVARERRSPALMVRWLASPRHTRAMLGLPDEIEACLFDLDGVLTTSATLHAEAWADTLDEFLLARATRHRPFVPFDRREDYAAFFAGRPRQAGIRLFLGARGIPPEGETVSALAIRKSEALRRRLDHEGVAAFEPARSYLEALGLLGIRRAVVSASAHTHEILERAGLARLVDDCVDGGVMAASRLEAQPSPDMLLEACRRLEVEPARAAAFEAGAIGVAAARSAGVAFVVGVQRHGLGGCDVVSYDLGALFMPGRG